MLAKSAENMLTDRKNYDFVFSVSLLTTKNSSL